MFAGHPNVKLFITHGGLMGTMEAVYSGVPMVAIPLFGDQFQNVKNYEDEGIVVRLDYTTITKERVLKALREVLENPRQALLPIFILQQSVALINTKWLFYK